LVVILEGNIYSYSSTSASSARVIAFNLETSDIERSQCEVMLSPGHLGGIALPAPGILAIGLVDAPSVGSPADGNLQLVKPGTALWSKGISVERAGLVELLRLDTNGIEKIGAFSAPAPAMWARFGESLDANGDILAVGEPNAEPPKVHLYKYNGAGTLIPSFLTSLNGSERFGSTLAIMENLLIVGAPGKQCCDGTITIFDISDSGPRKLDTFANPDSSTQINYGTTLKGFGNGAVIGGGGVDLGDGLGAFSGGLDAYIIIDGSLKNRTRLNPGPISREDGFGTPSRVTVARDAIAVQHRGDIIFFRLKKSAWSIIGRVPIDTETQSTLIGFDGRRFVLVSNVWEGGKILGWSFHVHDAP